jgi:ABC-type Na+ efflux pump permease subunit
VVIAGLDLVDYPRALEAPAVRRYLLGMIVLEFAAILLIVTNAAASTVTREKEDGSLDLLLTTPITSRYYIWGKLRGLVAFVMPLLAVPVASAALFVSYDLFRRLAGGDDDARRWIVFPEALLILPATLVIVAAFAAIVGMQMSLRLRTTVKAVMASVAIVLGGSMALGWCGFGALAQFTRGAETLGLVIASFSPITVIALLIDPYSITPQTGLFGGGDASGLTTARWVVLSFSLIATTGYAAAVYAMYGSMVKNFDMTIRRQSR